MMVCRMAWNTNSILVREAIEFKGPARTLKEGEEKEGGRRKKRKREEKRGGGAETEKIGEKKAERKS